MPNTIGKKKMEYIKNTLNTEIDSMDRNLNNIRLEIEHLYSLKSSKAAIKMLEHIKKDYDIIIELAKVYKGSMNEIEHLVETKLYGRKN